MGARFYEIGAKRASLGVDHAVEGAATVELGAAEAPADEAGIFGAADEAGDLPVDGDPALGDLLHDREDLIDQAFVYWLSPFFQDNRPGGKRQVFLDRGAEGAYTILKLDERSRR